MVGYGLTTASDPEAAFSLSAGDSKTASSNMIAALVLNRNQDPSELLAESWADWQKALAGMVADGALWTRYGGSDSDYAAVTTYASAAGIKTLGPPDGYVSDARSRTIWLDMPPAQFKTIFGTTLFYSAKLGGQYWDGTLSLPDELAGKVMGLVVDQGSHVPRPSVQGATSVTLAQGPQSLGSASKAPSALFPDQLAAQLYGFPLAGKTMATGTVGLIATGAGDLGIAADSTVQGLLDTYRASAGVAGNGQIYDVVPDAFRNAADSSNTSERSLDVAVVDTAALGSDIGLYEGGSGGSNLATGQTTFSAYQAAIWDSNHILTALSSSFANDDRAASGSPFLLAFDSLMQDAALHNISVFTVAGDDGSRGLTALVSPPYCNRNPTPTSWRSVALDLLRKSGGFPTK